MSRELGLASSTVATIWKNRDNIINAYGSESLNKDIHYCTDSESKKPKSVSESSFDSECGGVGPFKLLKKRYEHVRGL